MKTQWRPRRSAPHRRDGQSRASRTTQSRPGPALRHFNASSHGQENSRLTCSQMDYPSVTNVGFALGHGSWAPTIQFPRGNQEWMHIRPPQGACPQHMVQHPPLRPSLYPTYAPLMAPLPGYVTVLHPSILPISNPGNSHPAATTSYAGTSSDSTNHSIGDIRWQMQYGMHEIEFCRKCSQDLIHHFGSFSTQFNGRWHTQDDCAEQLRLNGRFRERLSTTQQAREKPNRVHASAFSRALPVGATTAGHGRQEADILVKCTHKKVIVRFPPVDTRLRAPLEPLNENDERKAQQPQSPHHNSPGLVADWLANQTQISTNAYNQHPTIHRKDWNNLHCIPDSLERTGAEQSNLPPPLAKSSVNSPEKKAEIAASPTRIL